MSDFRQHATLTPDQFHPVHLLCLPEGSGKWQASSERVGGICLPRVVACVATYLDMELGNRIAAARALTGMSQRAFADEVGVSSGLVGQWESHKKSPGRNNLLKIAKVCDISVEALVSDQPLDTVQPTLSPQEIKLIRNWRLMSARQQERLGEFIDVSIDVRRQIEKKGSPAKA